MKNAHVEIPRSHRWLPRRPTSFLILLLLLRATGSARASVRYVDADSANPTPPYTTWATAAVLTNCVLTGNSARYGGGAYGVTLNNCTLSANSASRGGGAYESTLHNCTLMRNWATSSEREQGGGGASDCTLYDCVLTSNSGSSGGGASGSTPYHCTVVGNSARSKGGGIAGWYGWMWGIRGIAHYSIIYYNTAAVSGANYGDMTSLDYCCTTPLPAGAGNITTVPLFVDYASGNLRLAAALRACPRTARRTPPTWTSTA